MKIFLSWSKDLSRDVAKYFSDWLPGVIQECKDPFISVDIDKGEPWFEAITTNLATTDLGIVFITPENQEETWLNFEAGAMLNKFGKSGVCPVLVGMKKGDYKGPMKNLQLAELASKQDVEQLLSTINKRCDQSLDPAILTRMMDTFWPELEGKLQELIATHSKSGHPTRAVRKLDDKVDELLTLVRGLTARTSDTSPENIGASSLGDFIKLQLDDEQNERLRRRREMAERRADRMAAFAERYGSKHGFIKESGQLGEILDYREKDGEPTVLHFLESGAKKGKTVRFSEIEIAPF